jgi:subtilisin-like proprotein convertase family protein
MRRLVALLVVLLAAPLYAAAPSTAAAQTFSNTAPIQIPAPGAPSGSASPYPSSVSVSGVTGPVTDVAVTLHGFGHTRPQDVGLLLVSPSGDTAQVMRSNCGDTDIEDLTWIFDQQWPIPMPLGTALCDDLVYRPNPGTAQSYLPPAPAGTHGGTILDHFNGENPNGTWSLYAQDFLAGGAGDVEGGWTLALSTGPVDAAIPGVGTSGRASPYPATLAVSGHSGVITNVNVSVAGIWHQRPDDLDVLLVGPRGQKVVLMSDACGTFEVALFGWSWRDDAPAPMPDGDGTNACATSSYRPTDHQPGDSWPSPAPPGPYAGALSAFDLTDPNGEWQMYINDDSRGEVGFFTNRFELGITTRPRAGVAFTEGAVELAEGATRALTLRRTAIGALAAGAVTVKTQAASATSDRDFTPISTTVAFAPGETERTVQVRAADDADQEPDEVFELAIDSAEGDAAAGTPSSVSVTIPGSPPVDGGAGGGGSGGAGGGGAGGGGAGGQGTADAAPVLSRLRLSPGRFAPRRRGSVAFATRTTTGTTISYRVSEPARVRFRLAQRKRGRDRLLPGSFTHVGRSGANSLRFSGRLRGRKLRPGAYRLLAVAADAGGSKSTPRSARFRIVTHANERRRRP